MVATRSGSKRKAALEHSNTQDHVRKRRRVSPVQYSRRAYVLNLPDEIFLGIFKALIPGESSRFRRKTFYTLSLVNQRFHRIAAEFLYMNYSNSWDNSNAPFIRSLLQFPELATHVKRIDDKYAGTWMFPPTVQDRQSPDRRPTDLRQAAGRKLGELRIPGKALWMERFGYRPDVYDATELALILYLCPNIEVLTLHNTRDRLCDYRKQWYKNQYPIQTRSGQLPVIFQALENAARGVSNGLVHRFTRLHTLTLNVQGLPVTAISSIFSLPSLRDLTLLRLKYPSNYGVLEIDDFALWKCGIGQSNVKRLRLEKSDIPSDVLAETIVRCRALETFFYECSGFRKVPDGFGPMISSALKTHRTTLLFLTLRNMAFFNWDNQGSPSHGRPLDPLTDFHELGHLAIPFSALSGCLRSYQGAEDFHGGSSFSDCIPHNVKWVRLQIDSPTQEVFRPLLDLSVACKTTLRKLRFVWLESRHMTGAGTWLLMSTRLKNAFARRGVRLAYKMDYSHLTVEDWRAAVTDLINGGPGTKAVSHYVWHKDFGWFDPHRSLQWNESKERNVDSEEERCRCFQKDLMFNAPYP